LKTDLKKILAQRLKDTKKIAILGIGSELMQDDAAGIIISQNLQNKFGEKHTNFKIYTGYTTPENFTKDISDFNPEQLILIDSADMKLKPGTIAEVPVERITDFSLGTHKLSLAMMIKYLREVIDCKFTVIAIQYKSVEFNGPVTSEVKSAINEVADLLIGILKKMK
jgi:hydrogenase 3 maturation protease